MAGSIESGGTIRRVRGGTRLLMEGFRFLRRERSLWALSTIPVILAIISVGTAGLSFSLHLDEIHAGWQALLPTLEATDWWTWIWIGPGKALVFFAGWLAVLLSFALSLVAALLLANLLSAPFLDTLSQRVEAIESGRSLDGAASDGLLIETLRSFAAELQRLGFLGALWLGLSSIGFVIPGAHFITGPLLVAITVLFLPLDYAGYALDRRGVGFKERRRWLRQHLPTMVGFGGIAFASCLVPGLNLVVLPSLVTGGTLLVVRTRPEQSAFDSQASLD